MPKDDCVFASVLLYVSVPVFVPMPVPVPVPMPVSVPVSIFVYVSVCVSEGKECTFKPTLCALSCQLAARLERELSNT